MFQSPEIPHVTEQYQKLIKSKLHIISHMRFLSSFNVIIIFLDYSVRMIIFKESTKTNLGSK